MKHLVIGLGVLVILGLGAGGAVLIGDHFEEDPPIELLPNMTPEQAVMQLRLAAIRGVDGIAAGYMGYFDEWVAIDHCTRILQEFIASHGQALGALEDPQQDTEDQTEDQEERDDP